MKPPWTPSSSQRTRAIRPSMIRVIRDRARPTSLDLGLGQSDQPVDEAACRALEAIAQQARAPYGPNLGLDSTRAAVADHFGLTSEQVMITCGVQEALAVALLGLVEPGDEVLVPEPGFPAYANLARLAGAVPVPYVLDGEQGWRLVPERVEEALSERTRALVLNSPSNPTGGVHARQDVLDVLRLCREREVVWISDEIYEDYLYEDAEHVSPQQLEDFAECGVRLGGLSKSHHMMGWRLGWLLGPASLVTELKPLHQHLVTSAPTLVQTAGEASLEQHASIVRKARAVYEHRRAIVARELDAIQGVSFALPHGAFYFFVNVSSHLAWCGTSENLALTLLDECDVLTVPGSGFGASGEGYLRLAMTVDEETLREALSRIRRFLAEKL